MFRKMLKSKLHRLRVTNADLNYQGSITLDAELLDRADIRAYEFVDVWNVSNGARFETYAIPGERGKREVCVNGAAARLVNRGDIIIVASHRYLAEEEAGDLTPTIVFVDENNHPLSEAPWAKNTAASSGPR